MKNTILLIIFLGASTFGFSQNKVSSNDPVKGIDVILKKKTPWPEAAHKPMKNNENNPLINMINVLEKKYLDEMEVSWNKNQSKAKEEAKKPSSDKVVKGWTVSSSPKSKVRSTASKTKDLPSYLNIKAVEIQRMFAQQDLSKLKNEDEVFKAYISFLKEKLKKINPNVKLE